MTIHVKERDIYVYQYSLKFGLDSDYYYETTVLNRLNEDRKVHRKMKKLFKIKHNIDLDKQQENIQSCVTLLPFYLTPRVLQREYYGYY
jgi:hypothetical protein